MKAISHLPAGYRQIDSIDLQKDKKAALTVNALALLIGAVSMLCAAAQALGRAFSKIQPLSLWLCALGALGLLLAAAFFGMDVLLCASPLLLLPEGILLVWSFVKR